MRRPWWAFALLAVGAAAILGIWFGFGGDRSDHVHAGENSSVIAGAAGAVAAPATATGGSTADSAVSQPSSPPSSATDAGTSAPPAEDHAAHLAAQQAAAASSATSASESSQTAAPAPAEPVDPDAPAADRRQISLGEAAGGDAASTVAVAPAVDKWVDADADGVNDGSKQQAAGVVLSAAPVVDPTQVLPANGLTNGCVAGYGGGTQCLPQTPPSHAGHGVGDLSIYWTCDEARTLLPNGISVDNPGTDPLGLDGNRDGIACGPGDQ